MKYYVRFEYKDHVPILGSNGIAIASGRLSLQHALVEIRKKATEENNKWYHYDAICYFTMAKCDSLSHFLNIVDTAKEYEVKGSK